MKKLKPIAIKRTIQIFFFALILLISLGHTLEESGITIPGITSVSLHAVCPFGGVVSIYEFFVSGTYVQKIHESSFILMFIVFGLALLLGPVFCGWICPFGTFQEWISKIGKKIFKKKFNKFIPYSVDKYLRYIRYAVLILIIVKTAQSAKLMFADIDPYYALFNIWSDEVAITAYISLALTIVLSLFVERPFCKYFCPYGAVLGITNFFKIFRIKRNEESCISCKICDNKCPMNIPLSDIKTSRNHQCISCMECTSESHCPKENTLTMTAGKSKHIKIKIIAVIITLFFVVGIGGTMALNLWKTSSSKIPQIFDEGENAGEYNPADIRGSYSFLDIENIFNIPVYDLAKAFGIQESSNPEAFLIKELEEIYTFESDIEIGTDSVRLFVSLYKNLPFVAEETTRLPQQSYSVLKDRIEPEQDEFLKSILIELDIEVKILESTDEEHETSSEQLITGRTTFKQLLDMGITENDLIEIIGSVPEDLNSTIRNYSEENSLEFSVIKESLESRM